MAGLGRFVAVGSSDNDISNIGYSTDSGQTWTVAAPAEQYGLFANDGLPHSNTRGYGIAYGNGIFVAVGSNYVVDGSNIGFSNDGGETWTVVEPADQDGLFSSDRGYAIAYGNDRFVAVGDSLDDESSIGFSTNGGQNWTLASDTNGLFDQGNGYGIASDGNDRFVAVGSANDSAYRIGFSTNGGQNWTLSANPEGLFEGGDGRGIAYGLVEGSGVFVAVGSSTNDLSNIGYSLNGGETWLVANNTAGLFQGGTGRGITFGGGVFIAVGSSTDTNLITGVSPNGQNWGTLPNPNGLFQGVGDSFGGFGIAYDGNGTFVAVGNSTDDLSNIGYFPIYGAGAGEWIVTPNPNGLFNGRGFAIAFSTPPPISNICFPAGTPIKTDQGLIPIEKLHANKHTINKYTINKQPIQHITKTVTQDTHLICFEQNALGPNVPSARTRMTKEHKILFEGQYKPASYFLTRSNKVKKVKYNGELLYNVLLANYGTLQVNNLVCETLHPDNLIAKLYNNYKEAERPDLVCQLNASLLERDAKKYKAVERKILHK